MNSILIRNEYRLTMRDILETKGTNEEEKKRIEKNRRNTFDGFLSFDMCNQVEQKPLFLFIKKTDFQGLGHQFRSHFQACFPYFASVSLIPPALLTQLIRFSLNCSLGKLGAGGRGEAFKY